MALQTIRTLGRVNEVIQSLENARLDDKLSQDALNLLYDLAHTLAPQELIVCVDSRIATRGGVTVKLSHNHAAALHVLHRSGGVVSVPEIAKALYGTQAHKRSVNVIRVYMNELRNRLVPLNVDIVNIFKKGYRLDMKPMRGYGE